MVVAHPRAESRDDYRLHLVRRMGMEAFLRLLAGQDSYPLAHTRVEDGEILSLEQLKPELKVFGSLRHVVKQKLQQLNAILNRIRDVRWAQYGRLIWRQEGGGRECRAWVLG